MKDIHKDSIIKYERAIQNDSRIYLERHIHQDIKWQRYPQRTNQRIVLKDISRAENFRMVDIGINA